MNRKTLTLFGLLCMLGGMVTLVAYSVPLYELFCRVTGYGGTTQVADGRNGPALDRVMTIRFNADTDPKLPWKFAPKQLSMKVRVGEPALAIYTAQSLAEDGDVTGTATFNVVPAKAGIYFSKIECFCFTEQKLAAGESTEMPVQFFVDPSIADDPNLDEVETITLSYTFFRKAQKSGPDLRATLNN